MLPTSNQPRAGNRWRSARNKSVMQKATDIVSSTMTWSTRNVKNKNASYNAYKKSDTRSSGNGMIAIDTSYLNSNIPYTQNWPTNSKHNSKSTWHKITKKANRAFLDQPWLLPPIMGTSFLSAVLIIFFMVFANSSQHAVVSNSTPEMSMPQPVQADNRYSYQQPHRTMRKKHPRQRTNSYNTHKNMGYHAVPSTPATPAKVEETVQSESSISKSVDYVFNLFHNNDANRWNAVSSLAQKYCISLPHFKLENQEAIDNLRGNIGTLIFDIVKFNPIYSDVTPQNVLISNKGTFISNKGNSRQSTTQCELVSHLFQLADDMGMLLPATNEHHDFDTDATQFWETHHAEVNHKTINEDVTTLFDHASANEFYEISMELPKLVQKHCSHTQNWIRDQGDQAEENFYNSLSRAIFTVHKADSSEISDNVIGFPVIDNTGELMQLESGILTFDKHDAASHKHLHYSRCELLDKIVFHGLTMSMNKHIDFMYDAASKDDIYGFEILADLLDTEYCSIINSKLSDTARSNLGLHLWSLVKDIISGEFHMTSDIDDESNQYVITTDGGIMHSQVATQELKLKKSQIIHCSMVKEIIKRGIKYHSGNMDYYQSSKFDETEFEHRYDDSGLSSEFLDEMSGDTQHSATNVKQLQQDAQQLIAHLSNGEETEFVKLLDYFLEQYHAQWFAKIAQESDYHSKRSVKLMIEQTLHSVILGHVNLSSKYDPSNDLTILRKDVNELEIIHQNDFKDVTQDVVDNLERLPLLDEIFKQTINQNSNQ